MTKTSSQTSVSGSVDPPAPISLKILGYEIGHLSETVQLTILSTGVFAIYQVHAYCQEYVVHVEGFTYSWFLTLWTFIVGFFFASFERCREGDLTSVTAHPYWYILIGSLHLGSMGFSTSALNYVNYPTQVVFKSSKIIPVMVAGLLVLGKRYSLVEYLSASCFFVGLSMFTLADVQTQPNFDFFGVLLLTIALVGDAFIGNVQEKLMQRHHVSLSELVQLTYLCGFALCLGICIYTGELQAALAKLEGRRGLLGMLVAFATAGYVGIYFVLALVTRFGAVTSVVVTSCRKLITILLSFLLFPKPWSPLYAWASIMLFTGMVLTALAKNAAETKKALLRVLLRWRLRRTEDECSPLSQNTLRPASRLRRIFRRSSSRSSSANGNLAASLPLGTVTIGFSDSSDERTDILPSSPNLRMNVNGKAVANSGTPSGRRSANLEDQIKVSVKAETQQQEAAA
mmetsp:Transcript_27308/g.44484  ORF Transcript_27308/g.44484 Transcript_27308/m.44484 type:complete len:457 (+) Transcript_27308:220-1590(+)|eukprot:CAMPEP_0184657868 /NCGR_PEP_ID=MMETSP0308-20130426/22302_1 /TAXON_ID=38269 /ORGANISM="Gloeochaete witrockiana, Strain SAG 46.84" /LENGTH=456 /DNA_ID=CAMNT_0027096237 /DNA_START=155 /DNA_END=1525 /DNA_ORIENTATION=-